MTVVAAEKVPVDRLEAVKEGAGVVMAQSFSE